MLCIYVFYIVYVSIKFSFSTNQSVVFDMWNRFGKTLSKILSILNCNFVISRQPSNKSILKNNYSIIHWNEIWTDWVKKD